MEIVDSSFKRDLEYDSVLRELNECLSVTEDKLIDNFSSPSEPVLFVVGSPRSGTTLLMQILAATKGFCYPSNFLARFYQNVFLGARIEQLMQAVLPELSNSFDSCVGKTRNWHEPNEFGFFWEHYFPLQKYHQLNDDELRAVDIKRLKGELAAMEHVYRLPVAMKAMILNYNLPFLSKHFPKAIFVRIHRSYIAVTASLLAQRNKVFGDTQKWLSCKPRNWQEINGLDDPVEQVVAQLQTIDIALKNAEAQMPLVNWININYDELCLDTSGAMKKIVGALEQIGLSRRFSSFCLPKSFQCRTAEIDDKLHDKIIFFLNRYNLSSD